MVTGKIMFVLRGGVVLSVVALLTRPLCAQRPGTAATPDLLEQRSLGKKTMFPAVRGMREMVGCGNNFVVQSGMKLLAAGRNAVDAGIAATLMAAVTEEEHFSMGGEMALLVKMAGQ